MKPNNGKKENKLRLLKRALIGLVIGGIVGYLSSHVAGLVGSQCTILCNQAVAIPYFAAVGILVSWR